MSKSDLLEAPVNRVLLLMASPISIGMLSTFLFQVIDTYFVGKLGAKELAALGFASSIYLLLVNLFMGIAVGLSALVGRSLGENNQGQARSYTLLAVLFTLLLSSFLSLVGILGMRPLFHFLGADPQTLFFIEQYMFVIFLGLPILNTSLVASSAIRATGNIKPPEIIMGIAGIINLILDYLLIFGVGPFPRMEIAGAAWATFASWVFVGLSIPIFVWKEDLIGFHSLLEGLERLKNNFKDLFRLSTPAVATQIMMPLTVTFLIFLVAESGSDAVAAFGIVTRIEALALVGVFAVSVAVTPFVAQNFGAGKHQRIDDAIVFAGKASIYWGFLVILVLTIFAGPIAGIFSDVSIVIENSKLYLYIVAASYPLLGLMVVTSALFNGIQVPGDSLKVLLVKTFIFTAPLCFIGSFFGYVGILFGISISNILGGLYGGYVMRRTLRGTDSQLDKRSALNDYAADMEAVLARFRTGRNKV